MDVCVVVCSIVLWSCATCTTKHCTRMCMFLKEEEGSSKKVLSEREMNVENERERDCSRERERERHRRRRTSKVLSEHVFILPVKQ